MGPLKPPLPGESAGAYHRRITATEGVRVHEMIDHKTEHHMHEGTKVVFTVARTFVIAGALLGGGWLARDKVAGVDSKLADMITKKDFDDRIDKAIGRAVANIKERVTTDVADEIYDRTVVKLLSSDVRSECPAVIMRGSRIVVCKLRDVRSQ